MPSERITPVAVAVVRRGDAVLIGRRGPGKPLAGKWEFPGGRIRPGEIPAEAARRECHEETGLHVRIGAALAEVEYAYPHGRIKLHFFAATPIDAAQEPSEPFRWTPLAELGSLEFPPANEVVLRHLLGAE